MGGALARLLEITMGSEPLSWTKTALWFLMTLTVTLGLTMAFNSTLRHQVESMHSDFWRVAFPAYFGAIALLAIAMRFVFSRITTDATAAFVFVAVYMAVLGLAESAWHVRNAFSVLKWLSDWLPNAIALTFTLALVRIILWRQSRPDTSIVRLKLSGSAFDSEIVKTDTN